MKEDRQKVLDALMQRTRPDGEMCSGFQVLTLITGLPRNLVRRHCRALARAGLAEYHRALCTEDGDFAGAGYCITRDGIDALERVILPAVKP